MASHRPATASPRTSPSSVERFDRLLRDRPNLRGIGLRIPRSAGIPADEGARAPQRLVPRGRLQRRGSPRGALRPPRCVPSRGGVGELDLDARALARVGDSELERSREPAPPLRRRPAAAIAASAARRLYSTARSAPARGAARVKWWASSGRTRPESAWWIALERLADAEVELGAADAGDPVVDGAAYQLVREAAGRCRLRQLLDHPAPAGLRRQRRRGRPGRARPASARTRSSNRGPATAASSSIALVSGARRDRRCCTRSLTGPIRAARQRAGRGVRARPPPRPCRFPVGRARARRAKAASRR